ncbi:MAG: urease accessory protein UreF [Elainella sp. Prado103]|jgi:urease accessory protein|nr:urease accessory protein UreF [Elainella sp. Prado103]
MTRSLLALLQLVSPTLPVGAYTYSEGLETLVQTSQITTAAQLEVWLRQELTYGAIRVEVGILDRAYGAAIEKDEIQLAQWNQWLSAFRETEEIREQSWQMGRSLLRLLQALQPESRWFWAEHFTDQRADQPVNFAIAFAVAAAGWQIDRSDMRLGYLQSWVANLINAGVRLVPLGQTQGQQILLNLQPTLEQASQAESLVLECCSWGVSIASMNHETLYSRLFRS